MKKIIYLLIVLSLTFTWSCDRMENELTSTDENLLANASDGDIVPGQYIVLLNKEADS